MLRVTLQIPMRWKVLIRIMASSMGSAPQKCRGLIVGTLFCHSVLVLVSLVFLQLFIAHYIITALSCSQYNLTTVTISDQEVAQFTLRWVVNVLVPMV